MQSELTQAFLISLVICVLNYLVCAKSNTVSSKAIFIDSFVDILSPLCSIISGVFVAADKIFGAFQLISLIFITGYSIYGKLFTNKEIEFKSKFGLFVLVISTMLTYYCMHITNPEDLNLTGLSLSLTNSHFKIDLISKGLMLLIWVISSSSIKSFYKNIILNLLDYLGLIAISLVVFLNTELVLKEWGLGMHTLYQVLLSFGIGSLAFAYILPLVFFKINIKEHGSGNAGTTNVERVLSEKYNQTTAIIMTIIVGLLDLAKGIIPVLLFRDQIGLIAMAAVLGHIYTPILLFNGGLGIATFLGTCIGALQGGLVVGLPVLWFGLRFVFSEKNGIYFQLERFYIKKSFAASLICMSIGLILVVLSQLSVFDKSIFGLIYAFIVYQHKKHYFIK